MMLITLVLLTGIELVQSASSFRQNPQICSTAECFAASGYIGAGLDVSVNPCDNFYQFTCGGILSGALAPGEVLWNEFQNLRRKLNQQLYTALEESSGNAQNNTKSAQLVDQLLSACANNFRGGSLIMASMTKLFQKYGGWIVVQNDNSVKTDWKKMSYVLRSNGVYPLTYLPVSVTYDFYDSNMNAITIGAPKVFAPRSILLRGIDDPEIQKYKGNIMQLAMEMGAKNLTYSEQEVTKLIELEIKLANIQTPALLYEKTTIKELQTKYPDIYWKKYVTRMLNTSVLKEKPIRGHDVVMVYKSDYLSQVFNILRNTSQTTLTSYVQYRAIAELLNIVGVNIYSGVSPSPVIQCIQTVQESLRTAVSALYAKKYMSLEIKQKLSKLVQGVVDGFIKGVRSNQRIDPQTKTKVIEKIEKMDKLVAYNDELLDDDKVDAYYKSVTYHENYLDFYLNISKFTLNETFKKLREAPRKNDWRTTSIVEANAYYQPENIIKILAGIVTDPFYNPNRPNYMNYASLGAIIGHEINHGVSGLGLNYDKDGLLNTIASPEAIEILNEAGSCIQQQYAQLNNNEEKAQLTNNEDQADAVGVIAAYRAYQSWSQNHGPEALLPNYSQFTQNQLYWISFGRLWCAKESDEYVTLIAPYQDHSRYMLRVLGPLMNSEEFSNDFNCPSGSYMNPVNKCKIWS
ncbi:hypothetical protein RI129_005791 [Pyrocoelia pectoralis]|uniref:Uncharacterized protein n=1 Tax=Pyrocoelia pectoralis TaxID=417401 RepID=A0AAN7VG43_9COLE